MELADIKRKALAAREFSEVVDHVTFTLRMPTPHEAELAAVRSRYIGPGSGDESVVRTKRALLELALTGWAGALVRDVLPDHAEADEAFAYEPDAVALLLDCNPAWAERLWQPLLVRIEQRNAALGLAAKN